MNESNEKLIDLGDATEQTQGYNFDRVYEAVHLDKKYNFLGA